ncbi:LamG domain-containing protein [Planotetraspora kaengkrachanensis]|uniref:LamG domain-containing protein n=1 Tax=Planotetraspora kaengkrachanensis TaxID=575193 RepID=UPI0019433513|nr:LamG domain-containing protein [Planotetraspora kaengkrachanensis]
MLALEAGVGVPQASAATETTSSGAFTAAAVVNTPPAQPALADLTMSPGSVCQAEPVRVNRLPQVTAKLTDPDGDRVGAQFAVSWPDATGKLVRQWWSTGGEDVPPPSGWFESSGSPFTEALPASIPQGTTVGWEVRAWDGVAWGPWSPAGTSTRCRFAWKTAALSDPKVTSADYPGSTDLTGSLPFTTGVGRDGAFTVDSDDSDVVAYQWGMDTGVTGAHVVTTRQGEPRTVRLLPTTEGGHSLAVRAFDSYGNGSRQVTYHFNVLAGQPERASWTLDEGAGAAEAGGAGGSYPLTIGGHAALGADGHSGTALSLSDEDSFAESQGAVLDFSQGFTVSAWAKADDLSRSRTVVSQAGTYNSGVVMGYDASSGKWSLRLPDADDSGASTAASVSDAPVVPGRWTHLVGTYDARTKTATLYVDGAAASAASVTAFNARGNLEIGRRWDAGVWADPWSGAVDDLRVWDRVVSAAQVARLHSTGAVTTRLPAKVVWGLDDATGRSEGQSVTFHGGAQTGQPGYTGKAAAFDGADGYGDTAREVVNTARSFSAGAWVKLGDTASDHAALSQSGSARGSFTLGYDHEKGAWVFRLPTRDAEGADFQAAYSPAPAVAGQWIHLLGVYDSAADQITLYVNGQAGSPVAAPSAWQSAGGLQLGRVLGQGGYRDYWKGSLDDIEVFDRVVTGPEAQKLAAPKPPAVAGRWMLNSAPDGVTPDSSPAKLGATLSGGARIGADFYADWLVGDFNGINADGQEEPDGGLVLDGVDGYAATAASPLDTTQSFTIAGWASMPNGMPDCPEDKALADCDMTVLSLQGNGEHPYNSAFTLRWHVMGRGDAENQPWGIWQVEMPDKDAPGAVRAVASHSYRFGSFSPWTHLAVVYDAGRKQLRLYVDGQLENSQQAVSTVDGVEPFAGTGGLQFGRNWSEGEAGEYFAGPIDDVWAYQGVLSDAKIRLLALSLEFPTSTGP